MSAPVPSARKVVKKTVTAEDGRKNRLASAVQLRKEKRDEGIAKKRNANATAAETVSLADTAPEIVRVEDLPRFAAAAFSADPVHQYHGVVAVRKLLSQPNNPPVDAVIAAGILPRLITLLQAPDPKLLVEVAWAITNIASTDRTADVVAAGAIPPLVQHLFHADAGVRDQSVWCLGNIAGDCPKFRDQLFGTPNAVQGIFMNVQHPASIALLRNATWALSNFCRGKPAPPAAMVQPLIPALAYLVQQEDKDVISDAAWGLSHLTDGDDSLIEAVVASGVLPRLVSLMGHSELVVVVPALRVTGNVISGTERHTQAALDAGALRFITPLLGHSKRNVRREACWTVSNVAAGTQPQISAMLSTPGLSSAVLHQLKHGDWNVKKEAAWVVANVATTGSSDHVRHLVSIGVVEPLVEMLDSEDARMLLVVMDAVSAILAVGKRLMAGGAGSACDFSMLFDEAGLPARLEELQSHAQDDVYNKALAIIGTYYSEEEEEADATTDQMCQGGATFSFGAASAGGAAPFAGFGAVPAAVPQAHHATPSGGAGGFNHGIGAGVAPVQLFTSPSSSSAGGGGGFGVATTAGAPGFFAAAPPALPPSMFSFDAVSFV